MSDELRRQIIIIAIYYFLLLLYYPELKRSHNVLFIVNKIPLRRNCKTVQYNASAYPELTPPKYHRSVRR